MWKLKLIFIPSSSILAQFIFQDREHFEDIHRSGTLKIYENIQRVNTLVVSDRRLTLRIVSYQLNLNRFTFTNFDWTLAHAKGLCQNCAVKSHSWAGGRSKRKITSWQNRQYKRFFSRVNTGDESWIFQYYPETKRQSK